MQKMFLINRIESSWLVISPLELFGYYSPLLSISPSLSHIKLLMRSCLFVLFVACSGGMYGMPPLMDRYGLGLPMGHAAMVNKWTCNFSLLHNL